MSMIVCKFVLESLREFSSPERPVYMVGGAVRDMLLDRPIHDMDFVLPGETRHLARQVAARLNGALYILDEERHTTRVVLDQAELPGGRAGDHFLLDFAAFRAGDLAGDLGDRDFTINALAFDIAHPDQLIDPMGGLDDLRAGCIRACSPASFSNDPIRILRAVRQALGLGFHLDPASLQLMRTAVTLLPKISAERLRDELFKILDGSNVALAIRILDRLGVLPYVLPELEGLKGISQSPPHTVDVWEHTLNTIQYLEQLLQPLIGQYQEETVPDLTVGSAVLWLGRFRDHFEQHFNQVLVPERTVRSLLFLSALYHDVEKPATRETTPGGKIRFLGHQDTGALTIAQRGRQLALSADEIDRLETIIKNHMRVHQFMNPLLKDETQKPSRRAIYRYFRDTDKAGIDICLISLADTRGTYGFTLPSNIWQSELEICRTLLEAYWEKTTEIVSPPRLLSGHDLMQIFGMKPGKIIGQALSAIREAQAVGEIHTRDEALDYVRNWLGKPLDFEAENKGIVDDE